MFLGYQFSVGNHMTQPSHWAALPDELLRDPFELQSNALDNCAAACVCKSWQAAVNSSFVSTLHLYIHDRVSLPSCLAQWRAFLAARSSIGELKLTAGGSAVLSGIDNHLNPLACVPAECNSLTVDEHFAPFVGDYTEQPANLQHLAISYRVHSSHRQTSGRDPLVTSGKLGHLSLLISLTVKTPGNMSGLAGLGNLPKSLTSLYIEGWGDNHVIITLPDLGWSRESDCLGRLKDSTFHMCWVHIDIGSIANLEGLTSLNLSHSLVGRDSDAILKLTNLVCLDLTRVLIPRRWYPEEWQPWSKFEARPALCVFKFANCGLIGTSTTLDIASVQEIHTDRLAVGMETASIHLVLRDQHAVLFETLASLLVSGWSTHIVDLQVINLDCHDETLYLATIVNQVLGALLCLQSFHFVGGYFLSPGQSIDYGQGQIVLGHGYSGQLKNLKLQHLHYHTLDVGAATCLTSISLSDVDPPCMSCQLIAM